MKKKKLLVVAFAVGVILSGCSNISQDEYDTLKTENTSLKKSNDELENKLKDLQEDYDKLIDEKAQAAEKEMKKSVPRAWATTCFGDDCSITFSDNNEFIQIICNKGYQITQESVKEIYSTLLASMPSLGVYQDSIEWERISINFCDKDKKEFLEFILKKTNGVFGLESINGDLTNAIDINFALESALK